MKKSLALALIGVLVGGLLMTMVPVGAHHRSDLASLRQEVNRLRRVVSNRTQLLDRTGRYRGSIDGYQVVSECPDGSTAVWELQSRRVHPTSGLEECRQQRRGDLVGTTFDSVNVTEGGEPRPLVSGTRIELTFEERKNGDVARWVAGCNIQGAAVDIEGDRLFLGEISGTDQGCRDALHEQDSWLRDFFVANPLWDFQRRARARDRLVLTSGETVITFVAHDR